MRLKKDKQNKILPNLFFVALLILGLYLFRDGIFQFGKAIGNIFYPIKSKVYDITYTTKSNISSLKNINDIIQEAKRLQSKNYELQLRLLEYQEMEKENKRLKEILNIVKTIKYKFIIANVDYRDSMSIYESLYIDKGENDGVERDMIALKDGALLGRVVEVEKNRSKIDLITRESFKVSVITKDQKNLGILNGNNNKELDLEYIIIDSKIQNGDELLTSGISNIYPKGLFVGVVGRINSQDNYLYKGIDVRLPYSITDINEVIVIKKEIEELKSESEDEKTENENKKTEI